MPLSQFLLDAKEQARRDLQIRNLWIIRARWFYLILLTGVVVIAASTVNDPDSYRRFSLSLGLAGLVGNLLLWLASHHHSRKLLYYKTLSVFQILLDLWLASNVIYFQEGLSSRATILFAIPILTAGLLFSQSFAYFAAAWSGLSYALTLIAYRNDNPGAYELRDTVVPIAFYWLVFLVIAYLVTKFSIINALGERERSYDQLMAMLRHQLRHPSGVIAALAEMLEKGESFNNLTPKEQRYVKQLSQENHRLNVMISNLLEAAGEPSNAPKYKPQTINLIQMVEETARNCAMSASRSNDLEVNYKIEALNIKGEPQQLMVAFENIIDNALRYSTPGSKVRISISSRQPKIEINIEDQGPGISLKQQEQLQKRFSRYDEGDESTEQLYSMGLGLYVSRVIIERNGGTLKIESHAGKGTKVIVKLSEGK